MYTAAFDVVIERLVADGAPGWVECAFTDAHGVVHRFREKVAVVTLEHLDAQSAYPRGGLVACTVVARREWEGRTLVVVDTAQPWGIACADGQTEFELAAEQLRAWPTVG